MASCKTRVTLRLRYSSNCQSEWGAAVADSGRPDGAVFWIYDWGRSYARGGLDRAKRDVHQATGDDQDGRCRQDQGAGRASRCTILHRTEQAALARRLSVIRTGPTSVLDEVTGLRENRGGHRGACGEQASAPPGTEVGATCGFTSRWGAHLRMGSAPCVASSPSPPCQCCRWVHLVCGPGAVRAGLPPKQGS